MTILEINQRVKSKTTFNVPIKFGDTKFNRRTLFSYTLYEEKTAREIRFLTKEVLIYEFDKNNFLKELSCYNSDDTLKFKTKFEFISRKDQEIHFKDCTPGNGDGNHGSLIFLPESQQWRISFHRVDSYLGYKKFGVFTTNELGEFIKEEYYDSVKDLLEICLTNEYEYFNNSLDEISENILENGWHLTDEMINYINSRH